MKTSSVNFPATRNAGKMPSCETAVECLAVDCGSLPAAAEVARFRGNNGVIECHITVRLTGEVNSGDALECLAQVYRLALKTGGIDAKSALFRRVFCSDVMNQPERSFGAPCATSRIGQPPLPAAKFSLWAYHLCDPAGDNDIATDGTTLSCRRGELTHHWTTGLTDCQGSGSHAQTRRVLEDYDRWLRSQGMTHADHVVRTWWFVQNIDADYQGLVDARRDFFTTHGLTADTHYLASTGIAGAATQVAAKVSLDSYAIGGLHPEQVNFLRAPIHLCPTQDYGVTFERATAVSYADRRHVFISGTASIDHLGKILHVGDVLGQLNRTLENIESLLAKANANLGDLAVILVYLRDPADAVRIEAALQERIGRLPYILVHAPVCRPGWLIEIEGIAVVPTNLLQLPEF